MSVRITLGCDPELFIKNIKTGEFVSAHDLLPGTKTEPHKVDRGAVQVDGVAAEFNILPAEDYSAFVTNIATVTDELRKFIGPEHELVAQPTVTFPEAYFKSLPEITRELGCNPDFNAWTGQVNDKPDGDSTTMRTAAGHIHIGGWVTNVDPTDPTHFEDCRIIAKQLDYYLGLNSLLWDSDIDRRKLYGKAGSFRPKPYGLEYRPLSNVWLRSVPLQKWVYQAAYKCITDLLDGADRLEDIFGDTARTFIDNSESWWKPEDAKKSSDHKKLYKLGQYTNLTTPPPLPKDTPKTKEVQKPDPKFLYNKKKKSSPETIDPLESMVEQMAITIAQLSQTI